MKVVIFKSYEKKSEVYYNYGDDCEEVWHNINAIEKVKEVTEEEFEVLKKAVGYFNSKPGKRNYTLKLAAIMDDEELDSLLSDFKGYEKAEIERAEKVRVAREAKVLLEKANAEAKKQERAVKKLAKELDLSEELVREMLAKKNK